MYSRGVLITGIAVALVAIVVGLGVSLLRSETIYPGVRVAGVDLGGLAIQEAERGLSPVVSDKADDRVVLRYADKTFDTTFGEIGGQVDVSTTAQAAYKVGREGSAIHRVLEILWLRREERQISVAYSFDKDTALDFLKTAAERIDHQPTDAGLVFEDGVIRTTREKTGIRLDPNKSLKQLMQAANSGTRDINLVVVTAYPKVKEADFHGIDGVVASYSTTYKTWERDRTHNLIIACRAINGTLVKPGGVFSYNQEVGPRLKENGFRDAPMFVDGQVEPGLGGGVCQISTTLYNAVLLADMKIVRRQHHSRPVAYAPVGRDATVAYPALDFRFKNTSDTPIYIMASVGSGRVDMKILGATQPGREVKLLSEGHQIIKAPVTRVLDDAEDAKAAVKEPGRAGHRVSIYRVVKMDGEVIKRERISNDYYRPQSRILVVPKPAPEPVKQ